MCKVSFSYRQHIDNTNSSLAFRGSSVHFSDKATLPLVRVLTDGLNNSRFGLIFNDPEYTVASALIPQFKLNFLVDVNAKLEIQNQLLQFIEQVQSVKNPQKGKYTSKFHSLQISFKTDNYFRVLRTVKMALSVMFTVVADVMCSSY